MSRKVARPWGASVAWQIECGSCVMQGQGNKKYGTGLRLLAEGSMWLEGLLGAMWTGRMGCSQWVPKQQQVRAMQGCVQTLALLNTWHAKLRDMWLLIVWHVA